jgi:lipid-A-disaccharide synthase
MLSAGEPSGDLLAAEWVEAFRSLAGPVPPVFFGVGGPRMAAVGVELTADLVRHALIGIPSIGQIRRLRRLQDDIVEEALRRQPDLFIGVDYFGFNGRLASRIRLASARSDSPFLNWRPRIVQYVSPQVWASRPGRVRRLARTHDLLLSILPFETDWYRQRVPKLNVEFVGHPLVDRHPGSTARIESTPPLVVLLPGSRRGELMRHLPIVLEAGRLLRQAHGVELCLVLPESVDLTPFSEWMARFPEVNVSREGVGAWLSKATMALACTGTVTLECARFGVPTIAFYRASPVTVALGRRLVTVRYLSMPNLLACGVGDKDKPGIQPVMPEFIQDEATPEAIARLASQWLLDRTLRDAMEVRLRAVVRQLGDPGASLRAAQAVSRLMLGN